MTQRAVDDFQRIQRLFFGLPEVGNVAREHIDFRRERGSGAREIGNALVLEMDEQLRQPALDRFEVIEPGVGRVYALKGRSGAQALPVVIASSAQLATLGVIASAEVLQKLEAIWPAPLTAVLPLIRPIAASGGVPTLAVRVPDHPGLRRLLAGLGPLTATSANRTGQPPALSADAAARIFGSGLDFVVDAGPSENVVPSTIVDLTKSPPEILRSGAFPWS